MLRFLTVRVEKLEEGLSVQMRYRPEKEEGSSSGPNYRPHDGYRSRSGDTSVGDDVIDDISIEDLIVE